MSRATATRSTNGLDKDASVPRQCLKVVLQVLSHLQCQLHRNHKKLFVILAAGMQVCKVGDEENEDVVVDGDDTAAFGASQFTEADIQAAAAEHFAPVSEDGKQTFDSFRIALKLNYSFN